MTVETPAGKLGLAICYDVRFPGIARTLGTPYRSLSSVDFAEGLARMLPAGTIRTGADGWVPMRAEMTGTFEWTFIP